VPRRRLLCSVRARAMIVLCWEGSDSELRRVATFGCRPTKLCSRQPTRTPHAASLRTQAMWAYCLCFQRWLSDGTSVQWAARLHCMLLQQRTASSARREWTVEREGRTDRNGASCVLSGRRGSKRNAKSESDCCDTSVSQRCMYIWDVAQCEWPAHRLVSPARIGILGVLSSLGGLPRVGRPRVWGYSRILPVEYHA
jgi:hypothetical protein